MRVFLLLAFLFSPFAISKHVALFRNASHSIPTLHQNLDTLLPFLPDIAAGWSASVRKETSSSVLLVTLATPAFKHLLLNFMCFMHHRLKDADYQPGKYLVVTSSQELATWLSDRGVVSLILQPEDLMANATNDIFSSLRQLDLVLPAAAQSPVNEAGKQKTLPWGSLHYQSLMLERTVISTVLAGALSESQKSAFEQWEVDCGWQPEAKDDIQQWRRPVGGILLADNDAVWLSSPSSHINHMYRSGRDAPSFVFASDTHPRSTTTWESHELPCACFLYTRTAPVMYVDDSDQDAHLLQDEPALNAAQTWRHVSLCHIASTLNSLSHAVRAAILTDKASNIAALTKAIAPSFQHSSLGSALFLSKRGLLPPISHTEFMHALQSNSTQHLYDLLDRAGLGHGQPSCSEKADQIRLTCPNPPASLVKRQETRAEALPYSHFPPGRTYFDQNEREAGVAPCVVHANYAGGDKKERLLREHGLWALIDREGEEPMCDLDVLEKAFVSWEGPAEES